MRFSDAVYHSGFSVVDTHCHLNLDPLWENWQSHHLSAKNHQVNFWWIPGTNFETSRKAITIASKEASCTPFIGIHPTEVAESDFDAEQSVKRLASLKQEAESLGVTLGGIGEIGLDYFRLAEDDFASRQDQRLWLRLQLELALGWGVPVILHPTMVRAFGEMENMSIETASKLRAAGIDVAIQGGFESYVPKARIVLFEAAIAAANGLSFEEALATITITPARILGVADRIGSLEVGKDGDIALYNGDPFEYTTHCTAVIISGVVMSEKPR